MADGRRDLSLESVNPFLGGTNGFVLGTNVDVVLVCVARVADVGSCQASIRRGPNKIFLCS